MKLNKRKLFLTLSSAAIAGSIISTISLTSCGPKHEKEQMVFNYDFIDSFNMPLSQLKSLWDSNIETNKIIVKNMISDFIRKPVYDIFEIIFNNQVLVAKVKNYKDPNDPLKNPYIYNFVYEPIFSQNTPPIKNDLIGSNEQNEIDMILNIASLNREILNHDLGRKKIDLNPNNITSPIITNKTLPITSEIANQELLSSTYDKDIALYKSLETNYKNDLYSYIYNFIFKQLSIENIDVSETSFFVTNNFKIINQASLHGNFVVQFKNPSSKKINVNLFNQQIELSPQSTITIKLTTRPDGINNKNQLAFCVVPGVNRLGIRTSNLDIQYVIDKNNVVNIQNQYIEFPTTYDLFSCNNKTNIPNYIKSNQCYTNILNVKYNSAFTKTNIDKLNKELSKPIFSIQEVKDNINSFATKQYNSFKQYLLGYTQLIDNLKNPDLTLLQLLSTLGYTYNNNQPGRDNSGNVIDDATNIISKGPLSTILSADFLNDDWKILLNNLFSNQSASQFLFRTFDSLMRIIDSFKTPVNSEAITGIQNFLKDNLENKPYSSYKYFINSLSSLKYTIKVFLIPLGVTPSQMELIFSIMDMVSSDPNIFSVIGQLLQPKLLDSIANIIPIPNVQTIIRKIANFASSIEALWQQNPNIQSVPTPTNPNEIDNRNLLTVKIWNLLSSDEFLNSVTNVAKFPVLSNISTPELRKQFIINSISGMNSNMVSSIIEPKTRFTEFFIKKPLKNVVDASYNDLTLSKWINDNFKFNNPSTTSNIDFGKTPIYNEQTNELDTSNLKYWFSFVNASNQNLLAKIPLQNFVNLIPDIVQQPTPPNSPNPPANKIDIVGIINAIKPFLKTLTIGGKINFSTNNSSSYFDNVNNKLSYAIKSDMEVPLSNIIGLDNILIDSVLSGIKIPFSIIKTKELLPESMDLSLVNNDVMVNFNQSNIPVIQNIINQTPTAQENANDFVNKQKQELFKILFVNSLVNDDLNTQNNESYDYLSKIIDISWINDKKTKKIIINSKLPLFFEHKDNALVINNGISTHLEFSLI